MQRLDDAGYVAYIVGGSVRDFLLGKETKDHDIASNAHPDELERLFPNSVTVGKAFGVLKVPVETLGGPAVGKLVEIATFREDLEYKDYRHPKKVRFASVEEDAARRDFTINALYYDPKTSRIFDPTGGMGDLEHKRVKAIGDPNERFREDALRLLRAVRFTNRFDFQLDSVTASAVKTRAKLLSKISVERIRDELTLMWMGPHSAEALKMLAHLGLLGQVLPEFQKLLVSGSKQWAHTLKVLSSLEGQNPIRSAALAWSAALIDVGRIGNEPDTGKIAGAIAARLKMSRSEIDQIEHLLLNLSKFREVFQMREATLQRFIREPYFDELLMLHKADASATDGNQAFYEFALSRRQLVSEESSSTEGKLLDGKDLIQLGLRPGPEFSNILRVIEDLSYERKLQTKEEALEYVIRNFVK